MRYCVAPGVDGTELIENPVKAAEGATALAMVNGNPTRYPVVEFGVSVSTLLLTL